MQWGVKPLTRKDFYPLIAPLSRADYPLCHRTQFPQARAPNCRACFIWGLPFRLGQPRQPKQLSFKIVRLRFNRDSDSYLQALNSNPPAASQNGALEEPSLVSRPAAHLVITTKE